MSPFRVETKNNLKEIPTAEISVFDSNRSELQLNIPNHVSDINFNYNNGSTTSSLNLT